MRGIALAAIAAARIAAAAVPASLPEDVRSVLSLQICLDRRGFSCNTLDGVCGGRTRTALATWCAVNGRAYVPGMERHAHRLFFPGERDLFRRETVTARDHASLVAIPELPSEKAKLARMGYQTIREMYAERGHLSERMLERLNPGLKWPNPPAGSVVTLPDTRPRRAAVSPRQPDGAADVLRISLSRMEITAFDAAGRMIALFPCSIAASKGKLPPVGEMQVKTIVADPNYTHTEERRGMRAERHLYAPGPNNPVGESWIGLTLPTYGIHGTPFPERIGRAESHGCFRLANWNAVRLRRMCEVGTSIVIEK